LIFLISDLAKRVILYVQYGTEIYMGDQVPQAVCVAEQPTATQVQVRLTDYNTVWAVWDQ
jgi:hypothetical protein